VRFSPAIVRQTVARGPRRWHPTGRAENGERVLERIGKVAALTATAALLSTGIAVAHNDDTVDDGVIDSGKETHSHDIDQQHGGEAGHIDVENYGLELVSKLGLKNVEAGKIADVGVLGSHAYLAAWGGQTCKYNGVHVVDISDVAAPKEVAFVKAKEGSYPGEGVQALPISTPAFTGDILVTNNEQCKPGVGVGGVNLYDVTNPARPTPLVVGYGDDSGSAGATNKSAHEIHSAFAWDAGDRAYAVLVDNEEGADVDIVDITDPRRPAFVAEYDLDAQFPQITDHLGTGSSFLHDIVVKQIDGRQLMLASYWDGGYVTLDVSDPAKATYVGDSDFATLDPEAAESKLKVKPEGNAHQAEFSRDNRYIVAADEDFSPVSVVSTVVGGAEFQATVGSNTVLEQGQQVTGQVRSVGRACDADGALVPPGAGGEVALVERGSCTFTEKITNAQDAGYAAAVVFNNVTECTGLLNMSSDGPTIPAFFVGRDTGFALMGIAGDPCVPVPAGELGQAGKSLSVEAIFDGWGYMHLYKNGGGKLTELDTYAVPEAHDPAKATGFGDLSVHEVAMSGQSDGLGYVSYYAAGLRVIDVASGKIVEKGAFIDEGGNNFWGVEAFTGADGQEYVAASDRDLGLYILKHTPAPAPAKPGRR
jgi:hypothetical protein